MGTVQKGNVPTANVPIAKLEESALSPSMQGGAVMNKQVRGKILAKRIDIHIEYI